MRAFRTRAGHGAATHEVAANRLVRRPLAGMQDAVVGGRYRLLGSLGSGGMGSVYEALDLLTGCTVALKALQPGTQTPEQLLALRHEAQAASSVKDPHVCRVHYLGVEQGTPFIVMERLHGETLRRRLDERGTPPLGEAVSIMCQLLDALTAIHAAGIVHRDIKPSNIFLTSAPNEPPRLKVIDFGLARTLRGPDDQAKDQITGTLFYLAPEQLVPVGDVDARADVYAAGVTFYELLTGERAYSGSWTEVVHDIILGEPPRVTGLRSDLGPAFDDVIAIAMAKSRERRFSSAGAFKRAVETAHHAAAVMRSGIVPRMTEDTLAEVDIDDDDAITIPPPRSHAPTLVDERESDEIPTIPPPPSLPRRR